MLFSSTDILPYLPAVRRHGIWYNVRMSVNLSPLRAAALALLLPFAGCVYTCHRTVVQGGAAEQIGRPMRWSAEDRAFVMRQRANTVYRRTSVYPIDFRYFGDKMSVCETLVRIPTWLLEMPGAWHTELLYDIDILDRTPRASAVRVRDLPYYGLPRAERYGERIDRTFADPMFNAYRRLFADEIDFAKGDAALAAEKGAYSPRHTYLRTYERWLADHVPVLAWVDDDGGENLLLRRERGLDHYRDLKLVRTVEGAFALDAAYDTLDGENIYILSRGWAENRYFDGIPTSRKGSSIVSVLNLASGKIASYGRYGDVPQAGSLPDGLDIRIRRTVLSRRGLFACKLW